MTVETILRLDEDMRARLEHLASERQQAVDALLQEALFQFVEREELRSAFRASALGALVDYERTGRHATFDEVDDWLACLERGEDAAPPECHG